MDNANLKPVVMKSFLSDIARVSIESFPFRHLTIENVFTDQIANRLWAAFNNCIPKAAPIGKVGEVGELSYNALNYTPDLLDFSTSSIAIFASAELQTFICGLLGVHANQYLMLGSHRHIPPSNNGWVHTDCTVVSYPKNGPQFGAFDIFQPDTGCTYADDTRDRQPESIKMARAVACLYYLGNDNWTQGDGGETAIYESDRSTIAKRVPPLHNSLLAFDISPESYHSYLAASDFARDSYIWWYHCEIQDLVGRHKSKFELRSRDGADGWDRWTGPSEIKFETT